MTFQCGFSGTPDRPRWNIDGENYYTSELPPQHVYDVSSMSLIISPVESGMNNSVYYCFFVTYSEMERRYVTISSEHAMLIIPPVIHTTSQQKSSNSVLFLSIVTHTVCCGETTTAYITTPVTTTTAIQFQLSLSHVKSSKPIATSTVQSHGTSTVLSITSNLTTTIKTATASNPGVVKNLPMQGCNTLTNIY